MLAPPDTALRAVSPMSGRLALRPECGWHTEEDQDAGHFEEREEILPACQVLGHRESSLPQIGLLQELSGTPVGGETGGVGLTRSTGRCCWLGLELWLNSIELDGDEV